MIFQLLLPVYAIFRGVPYLTSEFLENYNTIKIIAGIRKSLSLEYL
jgi:hypothetical protein